MKVGDYIIYNNGDRFELGRIKRVNSDGSAFVFYHEGDTAARTPAGCMHELLNGYVIKQTSLGGQRVCPVCGETYTGYPAISRRDNLTEICPDCGTREALEDWAKAKEREHAE